jgi:sortase A
MLETVAVVGRTRAARARRTLARSLRIASRACFALGALCAGLYVLAQADQRIGSASAVEAFRRAQQVALTGAPDQGLWSTQRQASYRESLGLPLDAPAGVLAIPAIGLTVPIFVGTSDLALNRGVGWIEGTAHPSEDGNVGIAGHRDGYFRGLKDLKIGDAIEVQTVDRTLHYRVSDLRIVEPADVAVLDPTDEPSLTLVTCYPFYYVGNAPQRYIVRGALDRARSLR